MGAEIMVLGVVVAMMVLCGVVNKKINVIFDSKFVCGPVEGKIRNKTQGEMLRHIQRFGLMMSVGKHHHHYMDKGACWMVWQ